MKIQQSALIADLGRQLRMEASEFLQAHVVAILYRAHSRDQRDVGTGLIASIGQRELLVTAGRVCEDLAKLVAGGDLAELRLCYRREAGCREWSQLPTGQELVDGIRWDQTDSAADIGILNLPGQILDRTRTVGVGRIDEAKFVDPSEAPTRRTSLLVGINPGQTKQDSEDDPIVFEAGQPDPQPDRVVSRLSFRMQPVRNLAVVSPSQCAATTNATSVDAFQGLSGGPIVEIFQTPASPLSDFRVLAVQSACASDRSGVVQLSVIPGRRAIEVARRLAASL